MLSKILFGLLLIVAVSSAKDLISFTISSYILPDKKLSMELDVVVPRSPNKYPVIFFLTGLSGIAPSIFQKSLIDQIAEQGYAWMTVSKLESPNPQKITNLLKMVMEWVSANIQEILNSRAPGVIADFEDRLTLMGHSAAGHVVTQYLNGTCGDVKLAIMLSPVDGVDPFGIKKNFIITPGKFLPYATPTLILATQLDSHSRKLQPPCAPSNMSNLRFYDAMSGPKWFLNASKYGHADFFDSPYREVAATICATCSKDCEFSKYRILVKEMILSFIDAILNKDKLALSYIEQAKFSIPTDHKHDYMGYDPLQGGFCKRLQKRQFDRFEV